jgi:hypothetical protein
MKTPFFVMLCLGFCGAWIASCKDDDERACVPQETRVCAGVGRCVGVETCLPDGSGYGECDCSGPMREGAAGTSNEPTGTTPFVGRACTDDAACGTGLTCITSTSNEFLGGGPGNGYCTLSCESDAECTSIDPQSQCVASNLDGTSGLCLRTCLSQNPRSLDENKCLGRRDVVCQSEAYLGLAMFSGSRQRGWCYPQCGSDADCPGRRCDLARGICVDTPTPGLPIGAKCAADVDCAGRLCVPLAGGESFCSAPCVFGQRLGCGDGLSGPRTAGCVAVQVAGFLSQEGIGDVGYCVELCGQSSECEQATTGNWQCEAIADIEQRFNAAGICDAPDVGDGGIDGGANDDASTPSVGDAG